MRGRRGSGSWCRSFSTRSGSRAFARRWTTTIRVLVAASAAIPIFGFHDWEYHRLREVLIYPDCVRRRLSEPWRVR